MPNRKQKQLKDRLKDLKNQKHLVFDNNDLDSKISRISSQIRLCEYDLNGNFPNNIAITHKLNTLKQLKQELELQLVQLNSRDASNSNAEAGVYPPVHHPGII